MSQGSKKKRRSCKLITFGSLKGSDDSEDSDYEPSNDPKPRTKTTKQSTKSSKPVGKKSKKVDSMHPQNTSLDWSHRIPNELLHNVFIYAVYNFTAVPLLCRVAQVCQKWNTVSSDPSLWFNIDLSFMASSLKANDKVLNLLRARNVLEYVQDFNLHGWIRLTNAGLEIVATDCRNLSSLNLSKCKLINAQGLSLIASKCKKLESVNFSFMQANATSNKSIKNLILERGSQLKTLNLAGNKSIGTPSLLALQSCSNLKVLDLSCTGSTVGTTLHVERLQTGCPHLVELRLSQLSLLPSIVTSHQINASGGFPELELLSLARSTGEDNVDDILLQRLLKTSSKLRQLDLRGCERITHQAFLDLPMLSLEQLFLSRCQILCLKIVEARWKDSLQELDVSWVPQLNDAALLVLAGAQTSNTVLKVLNLAGSGVTVVGLRSILDCCSKLTELNLTSCRGVPRGFKQRHDIESIKTMRTQLHVSPEQVELD